MAATAWVAAEPMISSTPRFSQFAKGAEQIAFPFIDKKTQAPGKQFEIKLGEAAQFRMIAISFSLSFRQIDQKIDVAHIALAQQIVVQHRGERWRDRDRQFKRHAIVHQVLHHSEQRDVRLGDRFEEPIFL